MTALVVEALLASSLLMLLVLALRRPVRRLFGPQVAYALWAIPVLRLVLPPLPEGWRGEALPVLPAPEPIVISLGAPVATLPLDAPGGGVGWPTVAILLWGAGAMLFLLWQVADYLRFRFRVLHHGIAVERVRRVTVVQSAAAAGPLAFGILDRVVAFPRDFAARFDADERALALEHELGHHARGDLIANWFALAMLALHWYNPVAWIAFRAYRVDQEMANDAWVLARCGADRRHAYGCAIVKSAYGRSVTAMCHLHNVKDLKGRLRMLGAKGATRAQVATGALATATLAMGALALTASGTQAAERMRLGVEDAAGVELAALDPLAALQATTPAAPVMLSPVPDVPAVPAPPRTGKRHTKVVVTEDGVSTVYEGAEAEAYVAAHPVPVPPAPPTVSGVPVPPAPPSPPPAPAAHNAARAFADVPRAIRRDCADAEGGDIRRLVLHQVQDGRQVTIVCMNRIHRVTADAARQARDVARQERDVARQERDAARQVRDAARQAQDAERQERDAARQARDAERQAIDAQMIRRDAMRTALTSLEHARTGLTTNRTLSAEQRTHALAGIDRALSEMKARIASRD